MDTNMCEENKKIVRNYIENVINNGKISMIADYLSENYTEIYQDKKYNLGIQGAIDHVNGVRKVYDKLHMDIKHQVAEGDWVVTIYTMTGIHVEEWIGIKPTGKHVKITGVNVNKLKNGKIVEHGGAANILDGMLEIGAITI